MKPLSQSCRFLILLSLVLVGCAGPQPLSNETISERYPAVWELESSVIAARKNNLDLVAPEAFERAQTRMQRAIDLARADDPEAQTIARQGLEDLESAQTTAATTRDVLEDVLNARKNALGANAHTIASNRFDSQDERLKSLSRMIEQGNVDAARSKRRGLEQDYRQLELMALQQDVVDQAKEAIEQAKREDADDLAPSTMRRAREELRLAEDVLAADRSDVERAEKHAYRALTAAQRAAQISDLITMFDQSGFDREEIVLWYQGQLEQVVSPVQPNPAFTKPNKRVIEQLQSEVQGVVNRNELLAASLQEKEDQLAALQQQKEAQLQKVKAESYTEQLEREKEAARFAFVQSLFEPPEAEVYRKGDDVLIRAQGFKFPTGQSEIRSGNFPLLNKITKAVRQFPNALVVVSGHTDSTGGAALNKELSQERANKVGQFLSDVGGIDTDRITTVGHGAEQPLAANDNPEGRALNRRVEILLVNEGPMKATAAGREE